MPDEPEGDDAEGADDVMGFKDGGAAVAEDEDDSDSVGLVLGALV